METKTTDGINALMLQTYLSRKKTVDHDCSIRHKTNYGHGHHAHKSVEILGLANFVNQTLWDVNQHQISGHHMYYKQAVHMRYVAYFASLRESLLLTDV